MKNGAWCFFVGHREASEKLWPALREAIEKHIRDYGVRTFVVGSYGGFDRLAAGALADAKRCHPEIVLLLLTPYRLEERNGKVLEEFDGVHYPYGMERVPHKAAIVRANRHMVDRVEYLIAYAWHPGSNASELVEYARKRGSVFVTMLKKP